MLPYNQALSLPAFPIGHCHPYILAEGFWNQAWNQSCDLAAERAHLFAEMIILIVKSFCGYVAHASLPHHIYHD